MWLEIALYLFGLAAFAGLMVWLFRNAGNNNAAGW